jgi:uncharacterized repeat protein (TIGR03803 family)
MMNTPFCGRLAALQPRSDALRVARVVADWGPCMRIGIVFALAFVLLGAVAPASASTLSTRYAFCSDFSCPDGSQPYGALVRDSKGVFYGTTQTGGGGNFDKCEQQGCGVVFAVKKGAKKYNYINLHTFCTGDDTCSDGSHPIGGLVLDSKGNLYGTAAVGGAHGDGVVFEISKQGKYKVLYDFCAQANCADGAGPQSPSVVLTYQGAANGAVYDGKSPLYGTTVAGGAHFQNGTIFSLTPRGKKWTEKVIYSFCSQALCTDGGQPLGLTMDSSGTMYGATHSGGGNRGDEFDEGGGTAFKFADGQMTTLYRFCAQSSCTDGEYPYGTVVPDAAGDVFGTTQIGGANDFGVLFEVSAAGTFSKLHDFCSQPNCTDGSFANAPLVFDTGGNLLGTTAGGGDTNGGTIFRMGGTYKVLYSFCSVGGSSCFDGDDTQTPLITDGQGHFYGTTFEGGTGHVTQADGGTVFEFDP